MNKPTLILGASPDPDRYSYKAAVQLTKHGHSIFPVGIKKGAILGHAILNGRPELKDIHTVTLYLNAKNQQEWFRYILDLKPKRIIFNPGAENSQLYETATQQGVECMEACTLVMLSIGTF